MTSHLAPIDVSNEVIDQWLHLADQITFPGVFHEICEFRYDATKHRLERVLKAARHAESIEDGDARRAAETLVAELKAIKGEADAAC